MKIIEIPPCDEMQLNKSHLVESVWNIFKHHSKQLLKGTAVLGAGLFSYGAWRYTANRSLITINESHTGSALVLNTKDAVPADILSTAVLSNAFSNAAIRQKNAIDSSYRRATNCLTEVQWKEFRINTYTASNQGNSAITELADRSFVVTWESGGQDGFYSGIYGQRYDASGAALGTEFRINTYTAESQINPAIAGLSDGNFVVVWESRFQDESSGSNIYAQQYMASGTARGTEFRVNTYTTNSQSVPAITGLADGKFVIVWQSRYQDGSDDGIYGQRYAALGMALGTEFRVNTYTTNKQYLPAIVGLPDGGFVVVWESYSQDDSSSAGIYGQRYNSAGVPLMGEFRVNTYTANYQRSPAIAALGDGGFVVAWESDLQDGSGYGIYGQRYATSGIAADAEFQVNTYTAHSQRMPSITGLLDGGYMVIWLNFNAAGFSNGVYGQRYSVTGAALGSEFRMASHRSFAAIAGLLDGSFVVAWQGRQEGAADDDVYGQRYWETIGLLNDCDGLYIEDINYALNLSLLPLAPPLSLNATITLQPAVSGQLLHSTVPAGAAANYNSTLGCWFATGSFSGIDNLLQNLFFNPFLNCNQDVQINIAITDGLGDVLMRNFTLTGKPVNDAPLWTKNQLVINQGEKYVLTSANLFVTDVDTPDDTINIKVKSVQYGQFELVSQSGTNITTFTQQDISLGRVLFVHSDIASVPSYALIADDGLLTTPTSLAAIDFNLKPHIVNNALTIIKSGEKVLLTNIQILAIDNDNAPNQLLFTINNVKYGKFQLASQSDKTATTFFQQDINSGLVWFIHDGSNHVPSYSLRVNDGRMVSQESEATVTFNPDTKDKIPLTETTGFRAGTSIAITAGSTLFGFAAWRYRNNQDAKKRRQQSLIGNIIRDDLNLSGVHDFKSKQGIQFVEAINVIIEKLVTRDVLVTRMVQDEQENFAHKLAICLKPYLLNEAPAKALAGDNIVTQTYRHYYYHKVKPLLKSGVVWLDTDAVKKSADTIAADVKAKLNEPEQEQDVESGLTKAKSSKSSIMMQPMRNDENSTSANASLLKHEMKT